MVAIPRAIHALAFDLDGTLADTFAHLAECFASALEPRLGRRLAPEEVYAAFGAGSGTEAAILAHFAGCVDAGVEESFYRLYRARHGSVRLFPGVLETLALARARGLKLGVLTGKGRRSAEFTLETLGVASLFDAVVTGDDAPQPKPDPAGLRMLLDTLRAAPAETLFVGDSSADIGAGLAAGAWTALAQWNRAAGAGADESAQPHLVLMCVEDLRHLVHTFPRRPREGHG